MVTLLSSASSVRALCFLLLLLSYRSVAFSVPPASRTTATAGASSSLLFGGRKHAWHPSWQDLSRSQSRSRKGRTCDTDRVTLNASHEVSDVNGRKALASCIKRWIASFRKVTKAFLLAAVFAFSLFVSSADAVSGGRAGGSFGQSRSSGGGGGGGSSIHRSATSSPPSSTSRGYSRGYYSPSRSYYSPGIRICLPPRIGYFPPTTRVYHSITSYDTPVVQRRRISPADVIVIGGTGLLLYSAFTKSTKPVGGSALGPGASVASITVCMTVPDRDNFYSILSKLKRFAEAADTATRQGVQTLVSNVALELLRDESSIKSARATSSHYDNVKEAEREFQRISVQERSKFDKETVNKYGGIDIVGTDSSLMEKTVNDKATEAVVTISLAIEGDQTELPDIRSREDLKYALTRIAADASVEDCLLAGELLWSPELRSERLTEQDVVADHPKLYPL